MRNRILFALFGAFWVFMAVMIGYSVKRHKDALPVVTIGFSCGMEFTRVMEDGTQFPVWFDCVIPEGAVRTDEEFGYTFIYLVNEREGAMGAEFYVAETRVYPMAYAREMAILSGEPIKEPVVFNAEGRLFDGAEVRWVSE